MYCPESSSLMIDSNPAAKAPTPELVTIRRGRVNDPNVMYWSDIYSISPDDKLAHQAELAGISLEVCVDEQPCAGTFARLVDYFLPLLSGEAGQSRGHEDSPAEGELDISLQFAGDEYSRTFCCPDQGPVWEKVQELLPLGQA